MNQCRIPALTCLLLGFITAAAVRADDGARKLISADRQVLTTGAAWGVINSLSDGSLGLIIQRARALKQIDAANVSMEWLRSTDGGRTWSNPVLIAERRGSQGKLFEKRPDGGYIVFQERNEAFGQLPTGRVVCAFCELNYHYNKNGEQDNPYMASYVKRAYRPYPVYFLAFLTLLRGSASTR